MNLRYFNFPTNFVHSSVPYFISPNLFFASDLRNHQLTFRDLFVKLTFWFIDFTDSKEIAIYFYFLKGKRKVLAEFKK